MINLKDMVRKVLKIPESDKHVVDKNVKKFLTTVEELHVSRRVIVTVNGKKNGYV